MGNSMKGCSDSVIFKPLSLAAEIARLIRPFGLVIKNHYPLTANEQCFGNALAMHIIES